MLYLSNILNVTIISVDAIIARKRYNMLPGFIFAIIAGLFLI